jgi:hypothetical protein
MNLCINYNSFIIAIQYLYDFLISAVRFLNYSNSLKIWFEIENIGPTKTDFLLFLALKNTTYNSCFISSKFFTFYIDTIGKNQTYVHQL